MPIAGSGVSEVIRFVSDGASVIVSRIPDMTQADRAETAGQPDTGNPSAWLPLVVLILLSNRYTAVSPSLASTEPLMPQRKHASGDVSGFAAETAATTDDCREVTEWVHRADRSTSENVSGEDNAQDRTTVVRETLYADAESDGGIPAGTGTSAQPVVKGQIVSRK